MTDKTEPQLLSELMDLVREQDRVTTLLAKKMLARLEKEVVPPTTSSAAEKGPGTFTGTLTGFCEPVDEDKEMQQTLQDPAGAVGEYSNRPIAVGFKFPKVDEDKERALFEAWVVTIKHTNEHRSMMGGAWLERASRG